MLDKGKLERQFGMRVARFLHRKSQQYLKVRYNAFHEAERIRDEKNWNDLFVNGESFIYQLDSNTKINLYKDSELSRLIYNRIFEESEISFLRKYLTSGDTFLDVGANIGLFSLIASNILGPQGQIYSFEPTPRTYNRLCENIKQNEFTNINPIQLGLSNSLGELTFYASSHKYDAWNSFVKLDRHDEAEEIKVKTITLDSFLDDNKIAPDSVKLLKIDVEGWELNVFKGGNKLLTADNAPVLMVEFTETNTFAAGYYCGELYDYVKQFGYTWYRYNAETNELIFEEKQLHYPYDNLFAIKDIEKVKNIICSSK